MTTFAQGTSLQSQANTYNNALNAGMNIAGAEQFFAEHPELRRGGRPGLDPATYRGFRDAPAFVEGPGGGMVPAGAGMPFGDDERLPDDVAASTPDWSWLDPTNRTQAEQIYRLLADEGALGDFDLSTDVGQSAGLQSLFNRFGTVGGSPGALPEGTDPIQSRQISDLFAEAKRRRAGTPTPPPAPPPPPPLNPTGRPAPPLRPDQFEDPQAIADFTREGTTFQLPPSVDFGDDDFWSGDVDALTGLRRLQMQGAAGLEGLLSGGDARRRAIEDALFERSSEDIDRAYRDTRQGIREDTFGRGVGQSTITGDDLGRLEKERNDAIARARREAFTGAGQESRADDAAELAAVGAAFSSGTTGLQGEANVGLTNAGREQSARQFAATSGFENLMNRLNREQRERLFGREIESREGLAREGFQSARDIASANRLAGGIGLGLGGLASFFGPFINEAGRRASSGLTDLVFGGS